MFTKLVLSHDLPGFHHTHAQLCIGIRFHPENSLPCCLCTQNEFRQAGALPPILSYVWGQVLMEIKHCHSDSFHCLKCSVHMAQYRGESQVAEYIEGGYRYE